MTDKEHLQWIYDRLEHVHGENPKVDYMLRLKMIIDSLPEPKNNHEDFLKYMSENKDHIVRFNEDRCNGKSWMYHIYDEMNNYEQS